MRRTISIVFAIIIMVAPEVAQAKAVLIDASGDVKVTPAGGKRVAATVGLELADGSVVKVGDGGKASLLAESGALEEVAAGSTYTVGKGGGAAKSTNLGSGIALAMREITASGEGPTVHGMVKKVEGPSGKRIDFAALGGEGLNAIFPSGTAVRLAGTIDFKWTQPIGLDWVKPSLVVEGSGGNRLAVKKLSTGAKELKLRPGDMRMTKGREYRWFLATDAGKLKSRTPKFRFTTLAYSQELALKGEISKVKALKLGSNGQALMMSQLYYGYSLYYDMVNELAPLYARAPSPFMKRLLYTGYMRMGRRSEAAKYE